MEKFYGPDGPKAVRLCASEEAQRHLEAHPGVEELLDEAVRVATAQGLWQTTGWPSEMATEFPQKGDLVKISVDLGRVVGKSSLVSAPKRTPAQKATFAVRNGRGGPTRVVVSTPGETSVITLVLKRLLRQPLYAEGRGKTAELHTAYFGENAPEEPWAVDSHGLSLSVSYWGSHALVWDPATMGPTFESSWQDILPRDKERELANVQAGVSEKVALLLGYSGPQEGFTGGVAHSVFLLVDGRWGSWRLFADYGYDEEWTSEVDVRISASREEAIAEFTLEEACDLGFEEAEWQVAKKLFPD